MQCVYVLGFSLLAVKQRMYLSSRVPVLLLFPCSGYNDLNWNSTFKFHITCFSILLIGLNIVQNIYPFGFSLKFLFLAEGCNEMNCQTMIHCEMKRNSLFINEEMAHDYIEEMATINPE